MRYFYPDDTVYFSQLRDKHKGLSVRDSFLIVAVLCSSAIVVVVSHSTIDLSHFTLLSPSGIIVSEGKLGGGGADYCHCFCRHIVVIVLYTAFIVQRLVYFILSYFIIFVVVN